MVYRMVIQMVTYKIPPTPLLKVAEDIVPIADFKAHASDHVRRVREQHRTMVITQNGKPAAVLVSPEAYDELMHQGRFLAAVHRGLADAEAGRLISDEELGKEIDEEFGPDR